MKPGEAAGLTVLAVLLALLFVAGGAAVTCDVLKHEAQHANHPEIAAWVAGAWICP